MYLLEYRIRSHKCFAWGIGDLINLLLLFIQRENITINKTSI